MTKWLSPGLIILVLGVAFGWLKSHDAAIRAQALAEARADSLAVAMAQHEADWAEFDSLRAVLLDSVATLEGQAGRLYATLASARQTAQARTDAVDSLLARAPDTVRIVVGQAIDALEAENEACMSLVDNCEARVALLTAQVSRDTLAIQAARIAAREIADQYRDEILKVRRSSISVGIAVGYGATLSKGTVYAGPSITLGIQLRLFGFGGG